MNAIVSFTEAKIGDEAYAYVDENRCSDHYCVFELDWFDEREGEIRLRRQRWMLLEDEPLTLPSPYQPDETDDETDDLGIVFLGALGDEATP